MVVVLATGGCATSTTASSAKIPDALRAPANQVRSLEARARGVQVYECKPGKSDPARFEWTLRGPEAELFDENGARIGKHYLGPTWELTDGSKVVGEITAKDPGPDPSAVPWLLLTAKATEGAGALSRTASIQRLETVGGKAPPDGCSPDRAGAIVRVDYRATYRFYRRD
jgi:hypothetical protein